MNEMKRTLSMDHSFDLQSKKSRTAFDKKNSTSIISIENLPNEILNEIFNYLDIFDIYDIFLDLNNRFQQLVTDSSFKLKIKLSSDAETTLECRCKDIIIPNTYRIISLRLQNASLIDKFIAQCMINSSFSCLQSIVLHEISEYQFLILLFYLNSLPRLVSLTISLTDNFGDEIVNIYRMIFHLPFLEYLKLSYPRYLEMDFVVSVAPNEQFSKLKYLVIDHACSINGLISILCHTPQLCRLTCQSLNELDNNDQSELSIRLSNLVHMSIRKCNVNFANFEIFIKKISFRLETLCIHVNDNKTYLDANRWEQLIANYIPNLHKFDFKYTSDDDDCFEDITVGESMIGFISPFWFEKRWFFEVEINSYRTILSIGLSKKKLFEFQDYTNPLVSNRQEDTNFSIPFSSCAQLTIKNGSDLKRDQSLIAEIGSVFSMIPFTRLQFDCMNVSIRTLMEILGILPYLDSLKVSSFPCVQLNNLSCKDTETLSITSITNKITKVNLDQMDNFEQIVFLLAFCPRMQHLQVGCTYDNNLMKLVQFILSKNTTQNPYFCSLCLHIPGIYRQIVHPIQTMIDNEKLLTNYIIKYIPNNIIIQWKRE